MRLQRLLLSLTLSFSTLIYAQNMDDVTIETVQLSDNVFMLIGAGGNIGVSAGDDGVFVVDDQYASMSSKIIDAIKKISDKPIHFLVNTHHHGDHTGGNENMAKQGVKIIAHDNVRKRLKQGNSGSENALPILTFNDKLNVYMNGEQVAIFHIDNAHTDGDAILYFTESNVLHTGDTFFKARYPYIDLNSGGSVNGYIEAIKKNLMLINAETKIIPGHGSLSNKAEYKVFLEMLENLKTNVLAEIAKGKTEDQVVNDAAVTKQYDDLGYSWNFITSEKIRRTFYKSLKE